MTQFKGTPGPWSGKDVGICKQDDVGLQLGFVMTINTARVEECAANARLIATAPELLGALQRCETVLSVIPLEVCDVEDLLYARAVINKALGETK